MTEKPTYEELEQTVKEFEREIVECRRVAQEAREGKEKYRRTIENAVWGVFQTTPEGRFLSVNRSMANILGYETPDELMTSVFDISNQLYVNPLQRDEKLRRLVKHDMILDFETQVYRKDKSIIWVSISERTVKDVHGKLLYIEGFLEDVTERRRVEEALKESEERYRSLSHIGLALSSEKDINKLLELILDESRDLYNADAGTLYIHDKGKKCLVFKIFQNDTMKTRVCVTSGDEIHLPNISLYYDGKPNYSNVSSYVALTGEIFNTPDVYEAEGFDFTGPKRYDASTGYRSKSMLVLPLKNHENDIIGVLQLLNAQDPETGDVIPFSEEYLDLAASLASQAAVALTNAQLIQDLQNLFYAFIKSIATGIDEKSPYTGGHIKRVVDLTMMIAKKINETKEGVFKNIRFSEDEMEELQLAGWMHDVGKITTPEYVVNKVSKLHTILDRIELIETRFQLISKSIENAYAQQKIELLQNGKNNEPELRRLDRELCSETKTLREELEFIRACNNSERFMTDNNLERLKEIADKTYSLLDEERPYLTKDEVKNLCIRKGNLTEEERKVIENHATMTLKMLEQLPFPLKLSKVPEYAGGHHEHLDGSGYPKGLSGKDLSLQTRILAIVDIFEALTAKDRPYGKPLNLSQALKIMDLMKKDKHIDPDIYDLFIESRLYYEYARKTMNPEQIDL